MSKMKLYLSGPMTGIENYNLHHFSEIAGKLENAGYRVYNPGDNGADDNVAWEAYLKHDLQELCKCQGVAVLKGWQESRGARLEVFNALILGMPIFDAYTMEPINLLKSEKPVHDHLANFFNRKDGGTNKTTKTDIPKKETILEEANRLVNGSRNKDYGDAYDDFSRTSNLLNVMGYRREGGAELKASDISNIMCMVKFSRECNSPKRDNIVDIAGYLLCKEQVLEKENG